MSNLSLKGSGGQSGRSVFRTCLLILLGILAVVLAFTAFAVVLVVLALLGIYRLVRAWLGSPPKKAPAAAQPQPTSIKESAFASGEVVDVPYTETPVTTGVSRTE